MFNKWLVLSFIFVLCIISIFAMGNKDIYFRSIYIHNGKRYGKDIIYWDGNWYRAMFRIVSNDYPADYTGPYNAEDIIVDVASPDVEEPFDYEHKELVIYCSKIGKSGKKIYSIYGRRRAKEVIVTDKKLNKPYVILARFTIAGPIPPNWKKIKRHIQGTASGSLGADAVIVKNWEVLPFKREDYFPITEFKEKKYVLYHCIAVAFEETSEIPKHLICEENDS